MPALDKGPSKMPSFVFHNFSKYKTILFSKFKFNSKVIGNFVIMKELKDIHAPKIANF